MDAIAASRQDARRDTGRDKDYALLVDRLILQEAPLLWRRLKAEARTAVDYWRSKYTALEDVVVYREPGEWTFLVERTYGGAASAIVELRVNDRVVHFTHRRKSDTKTVTTEGEFRFQSNGETVYLVHDGHPLDLDLAVEKLLTPVLSS